MKPMLDIKPERLAARAVRTIKDGKGLQVTVLGGVVWLTQAEDPRDVILASGQSFVLDRMGRAVVYAFKEADILLCPAGDIAAAGHLSAAARRNVA
jgi:hypothetical protein